MEIIVSDKNTFQIHSEICVGGSPSLSLKDKYLRYACCIDVA